MRTAILPRLQRDTFPMAEKGMVNMKSISQAEAWHLWHIIRKTLKIIISYKFENTYFNRGKRKL